MKLIVNIFCVTKTVYPLLHLNTISRGMNDCRTMKLLKKNNHDDLMQVNSYSRNTVSSVASNVNSSMFIISSDEGDTVQNSRSREESHVFYAQNLAGL